MAAGGRSGMGGQSSGEDEKMTLGSSARSTARYGTTSEPPRAAISPGHHGDGLIHGPELFLRHSIRPDDTVQSIALTYGVTAGDIRSVNNIWSDNHICLRDFLYIPLSKAAAQFRDISTHEPDCVLTRQQLMSLRKMSRSASADQNLAAAVTHVTNGSTTDVSVTTPTFAPVEKSPDVLVKDYFSKFDSSLAKIKDNIEKLEKTSTTSSSQDSCWLENETGDKSSRRRSANRRTVDSFEVETVDPTKDPELRFLSQVHNSKVRQTLEHLEKEHEEMFEL